MHLGKDHPFHELAKHEARERRRAFVVKVSLTVAVICVVGLVGAALILFQVSVTPRP